MTVEVRTLYLSILLEVQRGLDSLLSQLDSAGPPIPERFQHSVTPHENSKRGFTIGAYRALHDIRFSYGQADDCIHDLESALGKPHADKREIIRQLRCLENILVRLRWKWAWKGSWQPVYVETTGRCAPLKWPGIGDSSAGGAGGAGVQRSDLRGRG